VLKNPSQLGEGYYGYFVATDPSYNGGQGRSARYTYSNGVFIRDDDNGEWSGTFLNWLTMFRVDVAKKVIIGGKAVSRDGTGANTLVGYDGASTGYSVYLKLLEDTAGHTPYNNRHFYRLNNGAIEVYKIDEGDPGLDYSKQYYSDYDANGYPDYVYHNDGVFIKDAEGYLVGTNVTVGNADGSLDTTYPHSTRYYLYDDAMDFVEAGVEPDDAVYGCADESLCDLATLDYFEEIGTIIAVPQNVADLEDYLSPEILFDMFHEASEGDSCVQCLDCDPQKIWNVCQGSSNWEDCKYDVGVDNMNAALSDMWDHLVITSTSSPWTAQIVLPFQYLTLRPSRARLVASHQVRVLRDETNPEEARDFVDDNVGGVLQKVGDQARFGLEFYHGNHGGEVVQYVGADLANVIADIENMEPYGNTPLAESLYTGIRYFQQETPGYYYEEGEYTKNDTWDPFYFNDLGESVECGTSFILQITDGESNVDNRMPGSLKDFDNDCEPGQLGCEENGDDLPEGWLDDVALYGKVTDLRSDLEGTQNIGYFGVFAFGRGGDFIKDAGRNGGFDDINGNNIPDLEEEWDKNGDGLPDAYLAARNALDVEDKIFQALLDILKKAAAATSVAVLSTSGRGEGLVAQAYFQALDSSGILGQDVRWTGYLQGLWVDEWGNIREDTDGDGALVYRDADRVVRYRLDIGDSQTYLDRFLDIDGDGDITDDNPLDANGDPVPVDSVPLKGGNHVFEAGRLLAERSPGTRRIFTFADSDWDGVCDGCAAIPAGTSFSSGEAKSLTVDHLDDFKAYLDVVGSMSHSYSHLGAHTGNDSETETVRAERLVRYIRGEDITPLRNRTVRFGGVKYVWKLGDIISSTPTVVQEPLEAYHLLYGDTSYRDFIAEYRTREGMIYVGANDGMLHAIRLGRFISEDDSDTDRAEAGYLLPPSNGQPVGSEAWAYVPFNLLPHLKWYADRDYSHVHYVDHRARVVDVKIFTPSERHPGGWGTLLIGGMRLGGKDYPSGLVDGEGNPLWYRSAYFILDVTDPEAPIVLGEFTHEDLGLTFSYPTIAKKDDQWYLVMGSGPTDYDGKSNQIASVFVLNLNALGEGDGIQYTQIQATADNAFMADALSVDKQADGSTDAVYIGETSCDQNCDTISDLTRWQGRIYRLRTDDDTNPMNWDLSTFFTTDSYQPTTAALTAAIGFNDDLWLFLGTGRYLTWDDKFSARTQTLYGVYDPCIDTGCSTTVSSGALTDVTDEVIITDREGAERIEELIDTITVGWRMDLLTPRERSITKPVVIGGAALFTSYAPNDDPCLMGGTGTLYGLFFRTGTAHNVGILKDEVSESGVSGKSTSLGVGMPSSVGIHMGPNGITAFSQSTSAVIESESVRTVISPWSGVISWEQE
jgi:type IV pilus assembly protein PilY1